MKRTKSGGDKMQATRTEAATSRILERFLSEADLCETIDGMAKHWFPGEDVQTLREAVASLLNAGLLSRFGEGENAIYYCHDTMIARQIFDRLRQA